MSLSDRLKRRLGTLVHREEEAPITRGMDELGVTIATGEALQARIETIENAIREAQGIDDDGNQIPLPEDPQDALKELDRRFKKLNEVITTCIFPWLRALNRPGVASIIKGWSQVRGGWEFIIQHVSEVIQPEEQGEGEKEYGEAVEGVEEPRYADGGRLDLHKIFGEIFVPALSVRTISRAEWVNLVKSFYELYVLRLAWMIIGLFEERDVAPQFVTIIQQPLAMPGAAGAPTPLNIIQYGLPRRTEGEYEEGY